MAKTIAIFALACATGSAVAVGASVSTAAPSHRHAHASAARSSAAQRAMLRDVLDDIARYRRRTWHWQSVMGVPRTPSSNVAARSQDVRFRRWVRTLWHRRARIAFRLATDPPHEAGWLCIHRYEAAWNANTGNGYYGGLQMDLGFQRAYGARLLRVKGTADHWSPLEQMWVAERAHRSGRGYFPWPNTARYCGLI